MIGVLPVVYTLPLSSTYRFSAYIPTNGWLADGWFSSLRNGIMSAALTLSLREKAEDLSLHGSYHRLLLLVGPPRSGKTTALRELAAATGWPRVNLNLRLSERLLDIPTRFRQIRLLDVLRDVATEAAGDGLILDNIELLFQRSLEQDPLHALLALSRSRVVVAAWSGELTDGALTYAAPGHPEFRHYPAPGCAIVPIRVKLTRSPTPSATSSFR